MRFQEPKFSSHLKEPLFLPHPVPRQLALPNPPPTAPIPAPHALWRNAAIRALWPEVRYIPETPSPPVGARADAMQRQSARAQSRGLEQAYGPVRQVLARAA